MQTETVLIPFSQLTKSPFNVRRKRDAERVRTLAASIEAHGLLHNLVVHQIDPARKGNKKTLYGVADGERRRSAMELLIEDKKFSAGYEVLCRVITVDEAVSMSLAANVEREPMHPADELAGFRALQDAGKSAEEIAARYGVTPLVVKRRLKLANVAPRFLEMFSADELSLDQMMALAQTEDHERQIQVWDALPSYQRSPHRLREALTSEEVDVETNPIARYVGVKAYEKAGGAIRRDLFSDKDEGGYMQDSALLHELAQGKLNRKLREVAQEGWAWTETRLTLDHAERSTFGRVPTIRRDPTEEEQARLAEMTARREELQLAADASSEAAEQGEDADGFTDDQSDELWQLEDQITELEDSLRIPDPDAKSYAGVVITIDGRGQAEVLRGLVKPEDRKRLERERAQARSSTNDDSSLIDESSEPEKEYSERLTRNLTAHYTAALRVHVARSPSVALAALLHPLVVRLFDIGESWKEYVVRISHTSPHLDGDAPGIDNQKAMRAWHTIYQQWSGRIPKTDVLTWLLAQPLDDLLELLALCTSATLDCRDRAALPQDAKTLGKSVDLDMSEWWEPTGESFLGQVPKAAIVKAVQESGKTEEARALTSLKKPQAVTTAEDLLRGSRWIPTVLRV